MQASDSSVPASRRAGEVDRTSGLIPLVLIAPLRQLMVTFHEHVIPVGTGRHVALGLEIRFGLLPCYPPIVMLRRVYDFARKDGLIVDADGRELPLPAYIARAKDFTVLVCDTCQLGQNVPESGCWVCNTRAEQQMIRAALRLT